MKRALAVALGIAVAACSSSDAASVPEADASSDGTIGERSCGGRVTCSAGETCHLDSICPHEPPDSSSCAAPCTCTADGRWSCDFGGLFCLCPDAGAESGSDATTYDVTADTETESDADAGPAKDEFGVREVYPTLPAGREWFLPSDPTKSDGEWTPPGSSEIAPGPVPGSATISGSPRIDVVSPKGKAWWRNVEMTAYLKYESVKTTDPTQAPHWTFYARGERHTSSTTVADPKTINGGVLAPAGTTTWPGYPFTGLTSIDARCLGSSIKGAIFPDGHGWWKKEVSHTEGYTASRPPPDGLVVAPVGVDKDWFGFKVVIRNRDGDAHVHMETWLDVDASGTWTKVIDVDDTGGWKAGTATIDGCDAAPFSYAVDQLVTWAGPYVTFRVDNLVYDLKWASAREIAPLP